MALGSDRACWVSLGRSTVARRSSVCSAVLASLWRKLLLHETDKIVRDSVDFVGKTLQI